MKGKILGGESDRRFPQPAHSQSDSGKQRQPSKDTLKPPENAHVCPKCGTPILIENLGLREATTGILTCPKCDWSGKIDIQVVRNQSADE